MSNPLGDNPATEPARTAVIWEDSSELEPIGQPQRPKPRVETAHELTFQLDSLEDSDTAQGTEIESIKAQRVELEARLATIEVLPVVRPRK